MLLVRDGTLAEAAPAGQLPKATPLSRKRPEAPSSPDDSPATLSKRACPDIPPLDPHLAFLDEFYEFDSTSTLDCSTKEALVSEMMRSLEKAIGTMDDASSSSSQPHAQHNASLADDGAPHHTWTHAQASTNPASVEDGSDSNGFQLEIRQLLEASDDELGIPRSSITSLPKSELERPSSSLFSSGDAVPSWLLDDLDQHASDFGRDFHYDAVNLDFYL